MPISSDVFQVDLTSGEVQVVFNADAEGQKSDKLVVPPLRVAHSQAVHTAAAKLYVFGGRQGIKMDEKPLNDLWSFDLKTKTWELIMPVNTPPTPRSFHKMLCVGDKLYVFGGCGEEGRLADLYEFDLAKLEWMPLASFAAISGRGGPGFVKSHDENLLFVVGGFSGKEMSDIFAYSINANSWSQVVKNDSTIRPFSVASGASMKIGNRVLTVFFGGEVEPSDKGHEGAGKHLSIVFLQG